MYPTKSCLLALTLTLSAWPALALEVKLTPDKDYIEVVDSGRLIKIQRIQDEAHSLTGDFAKTSRKCPPSCIQPLTPAPGVTPVGEVEVFAFMETQLLDETGILIDARTPSWYRRSTIPGSINIPYTVFEQDQGAPELVSVVERLGGRRRGDVNPLLRGIEKLGFLGGDVKTDEWDFSNAKDLLLWSNGPWSEQGGGAIRALLALGYPAEKIRYYRGGMQDWLLLGLTTIPGK